MSHLFDILSKGKLFISLIAVITVMGVGATTVHANEGDGWTVSHAVQCNGWATTDDCSSQPTQLDDCASFSCPNPPHGATSSGDSLELNCWTHGQWYWYYSDFWHEFLGLKSVDNTWFLARDTSWGSPWGFVPRYAVNVNNWPSHCSGTP